MSTELENAVEVFVQAICKIKSQYYPYLLEHRDGLWIMRDKPRPSPRKTEVVSCGGSPEDVARRVAGLNVGWHYLCYAHNNEADFAGIRAQFKKVGYRAQGTEWFFVHDMENIPVYDSAPPPRHVKTEEEAQSIPQLAQQRMKVQNGTRLFGIWDEQRDYGYVRSVPIGERTWVQGLFIRPDVRRRGYGKALISALLRSDKKHGSTGSVLTASSAGATLYPLLNYRQVGVLQLFCPLRDEYELADLKDQPPVRSAVKLP